MTSNKIKIMLTVAFVTGLVCLSLYAAGRETLPVAVVGGLALFLVFALWDPPPKHKEFTYEDQIEGAARGCGGPPKLPEPDIPRRGRGR